MADEYDWQPIETMPVTDIACDDPEQILVWIANGGFRGEGCAAFGWKSSETGTVKASGYLGDFRITHWKRVGKP